MIYICDKCNYQTNRKQNFERHQNKKRPCVETEIEKIKETNEVNRYFCKVCGKVFSSRYGKYQHNKNVKCKNPVSDPTSSNSFIENQTNIINNIDTQNNTQNIQINCFGKEDLSYLLKDINIIERLKSFGKSGVYGLPKIISDVHFNNENPENNTIIKPEEYGDGVMIKNEDNEWEFREFEDIREDLIDTIVKYFKAYNIVKKNLGIQLIERKERNIIKNFGYELMVLNGTVPKDLYEELEMEDDDLDENEDEVKNKTRKFDKSTMKTLHSQTKSNYKKEKGEYVKNTKT